MQRIWHGPLYTLPFLYVGSWRRIMFPERGENIPFTVEYYAYRDPFDRETVTWLRSFQMRKLRRFDEYMIFSERRVPCYDRVNGFEGTFNIRNRRRCAWSSAAGAVRTGPLAARARARLRGGLPLR
jgi:hypothetical protein